MNKKKYIIFLGILFLSIVTATSIFVYRINFYGTYKIDIKKDKHIISQNFFLEAYTPTKRKIVMPFTSDKIIVSGFFKSIRLVFPCDCDTLCITIENEIRQSTYSPDLQCVNKYKTYEVKTLNDTSFFKKLYAFLLWFLSILLVKILFFIICFSFIFYLSYRLYKKTYLKEHKRKSHYIKSSFFFIVSFIFWILFLFVFLELGLRIFGTYYKTKPEDTFQKNNIFTVLCIGDSFTYGIGAKKGKSFPEQLEEIIENEENIPVRVINAGLCAANTFQILEQIQEQINLYNPDVVVMLFGMANSWNYYGFSGKDTFLNSFKTYKLVVRIAQNLRAKKSGLDMYKKADEFSENLFYKVWHSVIRNEEPYKSAYHAGSFFLSKKKWEDAFACFSYGSSLYPINDSIRHALWICTEKMDYDFYYKTYQHNDIQSTIIKRTVDIIDSVINLYPQSVDLKIIRYRYYAAKGDTATAIKLHKELFDKYPDNFVFYNDLEKFIPKKDVDDFYRTDNKYNVTNAFKTARVFFYLKNNNALMAKGYFDDVNAEYAEDYLADIGIRIAQKRQTEIIKGKSKKHFILQGIQKAIFNVIYNKNEENIEDKDVNKYFNHFKNKIIEDLKNNTGSKDSLYFVNGAIIITSVNEMIHDDFFLHHYNKRSKNIKDAEILRWVENDINVTVDICIKQGIKVIGMNYPLMPPPNSEETSYWAFKVGDIWKDISQRKDMPFIDQDSIFDVFGEYKTSLFEPRFTGTEHCNEKGYGLMARNIYKCMLNNNMIEK